MKNIYKAYYIFVFLLSISLITKYLLARKPLILTNVLVEGNNYVNKDSIINTLESEYVNNSILEINFKEIKETIYKNKFIDKLKIYRQLPSTLVIEVEEVTPIALIDVNNQTFFIDKNLKYIRANYKSINHFYNTPVINDITNDINNLSKAKHIIEDFIINDKLFDKLNEINFSNHKITLTMDDNTKIIFAKNNYLNDLKKFIEFHNQIIIGKGINLETFKYIDVSIPNQIIVKNKIV